MNLFVVKGFLLAFSYLTVIFLMVQLKRNANIGRFAWVGGVILLALYSLFAGQTFYARQLLVTALTCVWGFRLLLHVSSRHARGNCPKFFDWQTSWGGFGLVRCFFWVYFCQGLLIAMMALPAMLVNASSGAGLTIWDYIALALWLFGFYWEAVSDYQLVVFLKEKVNHGKILFEGLWGWCRHPNYFGELTQWWAFVLFALQVPFGWLSVLAPLTLTVYILFYNGIPLVEQTLQSADNFAEYKERVSLIPWFLKRR